MPSNDHDLALIENLERLRCSGLPEQWIRDYPHGLTEADCLRVQQQIEEAGYWPLDPQQFAHHLQELYAAQSTPIRRARAGGRRSIAEIQTPTTQSDAAWFDGEDFARRHPFVEDGEHNSFWLGRSVETNGALGHEDEGHVLMVCRTRSGKGTGFIVPNHLMWKGPLVSLDPKGENATISAARRGAGNDHCEGMGQRVCVLDPLSTAKVEDRYRARFNPLAELDPDDPATVTKAAAIADCMVVRTGRETEDHWKDDARACIQALILHIVSYPHFEGRRHLGTLRRLILHGDVEAVDELAQHYPDQERHDPFDVLFKLMQKNSAFHDEVAGAGRDMLDMKQNAVKQWKGVHTTIRVQTDWLRDPRIQACIEASDFRLADLKDLTQGMSVYLCLPERDMQTYHRWLRILLNQITYELQESDRMPACGHRVLMSLDEFTVLEKMKEFEGGIARLAGYRVKMLVVLQNLAAIQEVYGKRWEDFLGNSSTRIFFDLDDDTTAAMVSKWLGEIELTRENRSRNFQLSSQRSTGFNANRGTSVGFGANANRSDSEGGNTAESVSRSRSTGSSDTLGEGSYRGEGSGHSSNFSQWSFIRAVQPLVAFMRDDERTALSSNQQEGTNRNRSHTATRSDQEGISHSEGRSWQHQHGQGVSAQLQEQASGGVSGTAGESMAHGGGLTEQRHKRPLLHAHEFDRTFARINDPHDPYYPGLALIKLSGKDPVIVRRVNYYDDDVFECRWSANPSYPESKPARLIRTMTFALGSANTARGKLWVDHDGRTLAPVITKCCVTQGAIVEKGTVLFEVMPGPSFTPYGDGVITVRAPLSGQIISIDAEVNTAFEFGMPLVNMQFHFGRARRERSINVSQDALSYNGGAHRQYRDFQERIEARDAVLRAEREAAERAEREKAERIERERREDEEAYRDYKARQRREEKAELERMIRKREAAAEDDYSGLMMVFVLPLCLACAVAIFMLTREAGREFLDTKRYTSEYFKAWVIGGMVVWFLGSTFVSIVTALLVGGAVNLARMSGVLLSCRIEEEVEQCGDSVQMGFGWKRDFNYDHLRFQRWYFRICLFLVCVMSVLVYYLWDGRTWQSWILAWSGGLAITTGIIGGIGYLKFVKDDTISRELKEIELSEPDVDND